MNYYIPINNNQEYPEKLIKYYNKNKKPSNYLCNKLFNKYIDSIKSNNNILNRHNNLIINQKKINFLNVLRFFKFLIFDTTKKHYLSPTRYQRVLKNIEFKYNQFNIKKYFKNSIPKSKYIYFPLSTIPEASLLIRGVDYYDQLSFIKSLSLKLPVDYKILVKDHPGMAGVTPKRFYRELNKIYNVHLVDTYLSSYECIKNSEAVIAISGTTGMQSWALGKKTIVLGKAVYFYVKTIFKPKNLNEISNILELKWSKNLIKKQRMDFIKYIDAILNTPNLDDKNGIFWSQNISNQNMLEIDMHLYKIFANYLK